LNRDVNKKHHPHFAQITTTESMHQKPRGEVHGINLIATLAKRRSFHELIANQPSAPIQLEPVDFLFPCPYQCSTVKALAKMAGLHSFRLGKPARIMWRARATRPKRTLGRKGF